MGCLTDYIGIRWCGGTASAPSSLYVNDLPGISLKQINSITDEENATFLSVWNTIQDRAERRFSLDVREAMSAKYRLKSLAQGVNLGNNVDTSNGTIVPLNGVRNGFAIELVSASSNDYTPSPLMSINIENLMWFCPEAADIGKTLYIEIDDLDSQSGVNYYNGTFVIENEYWNIIPINLTLTDSTYTQPLRITCQFRTTGNIECSSKNISELIQVNECCQAKVRPYSHGTDEYTTNTYGLSATFNVTCSWDGLICQNKNLFSRAFWYLCGIEFLTELIYSSVLTAWTTINLQKAKDLRAEYEVEYQKSLTQVASGMNLDCDCCLDCNGGVQLRTATQFF